MRWRRIGKIGGGIATLYVVVKTGISLMGDVDFIVSRSADPGWLAEIAKFVIDPPNWFLLIIGLIGISLLAWPYAFKWIGHFVNVPNQTTRSFSGHGQNEPARQQAETVRLFRGDGTAVAITSSAKEVDIFEVYSSISNFSLIDAARLFEGLSMIDRIDDRIEARRIIMRDAILVGDLIPVDNPFLAMQIAIAKTGALGNNRDAIGDNTLISRGELKKWAIKRNERPLFLFPSK